VAFHTPYWGFDPSLIFRLREESGIYELLFKQTLEAVPSVTDGVHRCSLLFFLCGQTSHRISIAFKRTSAHNSLGVGTTREFGIS